MPSQVDTIKLLKSTAYNGSSLYVSVGSLTIINGGIGGDSKEYSSMYAISAYSSDSVSWTQVNHTVSGAKKFYEAIAYGAGLFVAVGGIGSSSDGVFSSSIIETTTDGITFTSRTTAGPYTTDEFIDIIYDGTQFVTISASGEVQSSSNGIDWVQKRASDSTTMVRISYINNKYVIATGGTDIIVSDDLSTYSTISANCVVGTQSDIYHLAGHGSVVDFNLRTAIGDTIEPRIYAISDSSSNPAIFARGVAAGKAIHGIGGDGEFGIGIYGESGVDGYAIYGVGYYAADSIYAEAQGSGNAMHGNSTYGHGVVAESDTSYPEKSAFRIVPQDNAPTSGEIGDIYVSTAGKLYICTDPSPTWTLVGGQT